LSAVYIAVRRVDHPVEKSICTGRGMGAAALAPL
jgi:hypothetical protein